MKKLILIFAILFCFVSVAEAWDEGGWATSKVPSLRQTSAPTVTDNDYPVPFLWVDETNDKLYLLIDNTPGAADWDEIVFIGGSPSFANLVLSGSLAISGSQSIFDGQTLTFYDSGNDTHVVIGPVVDGTTVLPISGGLTVPFDAVNPTDVVNLSALLDHMGIALNFWFGNTTLDVLSTDSETALSQTPTTPSETLTTIFFNSLTIDTPTPFTIKGGQIIDVHFLADVTITAGKRAETLTAQLGYVDDDGSSTFVQIGNDSDATVALTATQALYSLHIHVVTEITVPVGKRLYLRFVADATGSSAYPEINVYYDTAFSHVVIPLNASVLQNYVLRAGDTITGDLGVEGTVSISGSESIMASGTITGRFRQVDKSAETVSLTVPECSDTLITTRGWDGNDDQTFTLPDADTSVGAGLKCKILMAVTSATDSFYLDTEGSTTNIYLDGTAIGDAERVWTEFPTVGESIVCHSATLDGTTYDWFCDSIVGTWLDKGS